MFRLEDQGLVAGALEDSADLLFADTVRREEYARTLTGEISGPSGSGERAGQLEEEG